MRKDSFLIRFFSRFYVLYVSSSSNSIEIFFISISISHFLCKLL
jgi:hypothetical protein